MKSVTVTELLDWVRCRQLWKYRHEMRLEPLEKDTNMVSGSVVHSTIQEILSGNVDRKFLELFVHNKLCDEFVEDMDKVRKFEPGVLRALRQVPNWVWDTKGWHVEERITMVVDGVEVVGRPDLFLVNEEEGTVDIVEFKTTETEPLDFLLWNPQHQYYALMLGTQKYPSFVMRFRYVCLPTQGKYKEMMPWIFTIKQARMALNELMLLVGEMGRQGVVRNRSRSCSFCDFDKVCATYLTGGDVSSTLMEYYR
ncbi:MAG: PD-(D/E)XK nuclease family protein, partial [Parcubacteria group bacterium]|nr:PD-(D/E)XK nuclease family protein [Parcubacteria group bacterium]